MNEHLPTDGFDGKASHTGWEIGSKKMMWLQIAIGFIFLAIGIILSFTHDSFTNGMQYMSIRLLLSFGVMAIGTAIVEGNVNINWKLSQSLALKAIGWVAVFLLLYFLNPPAPPSFK